MRGVDLTRRQSLKALAIATIATLHSRAAHATVMRGLTLEALAKRSDSIVIATALDAQSRVVTLPGSRRIVTDVRVRVDQLVAKAAPGAEVFVRVLGGRVGDSAELVEGQAVIELNAPCTLFLRDAKDGFHWVNGMAQGHFPIRPDTGGVPRLQLSPRLPDILDREHCAVFRLAGQDVPSAEAMVLEALAK